MSQIKFRCSSIGRLMTEPLQIDARLRTPDVEEIIAKKKRSEDEKELLRQLKAQTLSAGAKTYVRELAAQEILGVDFEVSSKPMEKGIEVEPESIAMLNRVRGLSLEKNLERRENEFITGECDLFDARRRRGHDLKSSWSAATFPILPIDCTDAVYEWQMRGYMALWDADEWEVNYCLVDTPDRLIGFEPMQMHLVSHIPEFIRITTWTIRRDHDKEAAIAEKVKLARQYFDEVIAEFDGSHRPVAAPDSQADRLVRVIKTAAVGPSIPVVPLVVRDPAVARPVTLPDLF